MPRIRSIKPETWADEKLAALPRDARLLFIGLWNFADDSGRLRGSPALIRAQVFPYDLDLDVASLLSDLERAKFIQRYEAGGESLIWVRNFNKHQKIDKPSKSSLPPPPPDSPKPRRRLAVGMEGKGREGIKNLPAEEPPAAGGQSVLVPQAAKPSPGKPKARPQSKAKPGFSAVRDHFEALSKARTGEDYRWSATASVGCNSLLVSLGEDTERCRRYLDGAFALADRQAAAGDAFLASNLSMAYLGSSDGINRVRNALVAERAAKPSGPPRVNDGIPTAAESAARIRRQEEELAAARARETPESRAKIQELIAQTARSLGVRT